MYENNLLRIMNDANDDTVYLADINTHELLYLSPAACKAVGLTSASGYQGKPCYKVLQGLDAPCPFCTNHLLTETEFYIWEHDNEALGRRYLLRDRLIHYQGRLVRMEIAADITDRGGGIKRQSADEAIINCIHQLGNFDDPDLAINHCLAQIGIFYKAGCVHIYEMNREEKTFVSTYGWNSQEICVPNTQKYSFPSAGSCVESNNEAGFLCISADDRKAGKHSLEYRILQAQGAKKMIAVPLIDRLGAVIGLLGVTGPQDNTNAPKLVRTLSRFVIDRLEKRALLYRLDMLTYHDSMTGLYNRKRYIERIRELKEASLSCLGVVCICIDKLKNINSTYGQSYGDRMLIRTANVLNGICPGDAYRISGDMFAGFFPDIGREDFQCLVEQLKAAVNVKDTLHISIGTKWSPGGNRRNGTDNRRGKSNGNV